MILRRLLVLIVIASILGLYVIQPSSSEEGLERLYGVKIRIEAEGFPGVYEFYALDDTPVKLFDGYNYTVEVMGWGYITERDRLLSNMSSLELVMDPAPLIEGYVNWVDKAGNVTNVEGFRVVVNDLGEFSAPVYSNGYYAVYVPYPINSTVNLSFISPLSPRFLNDIFEDKWGLLTEIAGYEYSDNMTFYPLGLSESVFGNMQVLNGEVINYTVSSYINNLNITLGFGYKLVMSLDNIYDQSPPIYNDGYVFFDVYIDENNTKQYVGGTADKWNMGIYSVYPFGLEHNRTYAVRLMLIEDASKVALYMDGFSLKETYFNYVLLEAFDIYGDCEPDFCIDTYRIEDLGQDEWGMGWLTGSITSRTGVIPPSIEIIVIGSASTTFYNFDVFGSYTVSPHDGGFILPLPFGAMDQIEYYIVNRNPDGSVAILYNGVINNPKSFARSTLDMGEIVLPMDVYRLTGVVTDISSVPEMVGVYASGVSQQDPDMNVVIPGYVYENGTFEIYIIQNLVKDSNIHIFTYSVDITSSFYCQLNRPDFPNAIYAADSFLGSTQCITENLKDVSIKIYRSAPPVPITLEDAPVLRLMVNFDERADLEEYHSSYYILERIDNIISVKLLPDSQGNIYPTSIIFGYLERDVESGAGRLGILTLHPPGTDLALEIRFADTTLSPEFAGYLGFYNYIRPIQINYVFEPVDPNNSWFNLTGYFTITIQSTDGDRPMFTMLVLDSPSVIDEFPSSLLRVFYSVITVLIIGVLTRIIYRIRRG